MSEARLQAEHFLEHEKQFHLGVLWTEQPHPKTMSFGQTIRRDTEQGVKMLLEVDQDIPPIAEHVLRSSEYGELVTALVQCIDGGGRICFSGCGASGRVAIILEAMWRTFWQEASERLPEHKDLYSELADAVVSIMTGGDRALIRSVESFEDYQVFGRRQVIEAQLGKGDVLIAMSEDGVLSSVIGTAKEAVERGCRVFLIFNNPRDTLFKFMQRSRDVLEDPQITKLELTTGHMALTGSTRLQATSIAMLILGAAMEETITTLARKTAPMYVNALQSVEPEEIRHQYASLFKGLVDQLSGKDALAGLARFVDLESRVYSHQGLVTYIADRYLLDIFSDTTERTPTFMIPPFHQYDDAKAPEPWAFAQDPLRPTEEAWSHLLRRRPRGLDWTAEDYRAMDAEKSMIQNPPPISRDQIYKFRIGQETDPARYASLRSALVWVYFEEEWPDRLHRYFADNMIKYSDPAIVSLGSTPVAVPGSETIPIPLDLPLTSCSLFRHLAVKLVFNALSTGTMGKLRRIHGNWMIQVDATNKKLTDRSIRLIANLAGIPYEEACYEFYKTSVAPDSHRLQFKDSYVVQTLKRLNVDLSQ